MKNNLLTTSIMLIDKQTLKDLDIFGGDQDHTSIFQWMNKTRTTGGSNRLLEKMSNPPHGFDDLLIQEQTIHYLVDHDLKDRLPFGDMELNALDEYFSSNIDTVASTSLWSSLQFVMADLSSYRFLQSSLPEAVRLVETLHQWLNADHDNLPSVLATFNKQVEFIWHDRDFQKAKSLIEHHHVSFHRWLQADQLLRLTLKEPFKALIEQYFELDALISMASTARMFGFTFPAWRKNSEPLFEVQELRHPLLKEGIPVSVTIDKAHHLLFLTGPNMSGKTTFLKSIGLALYFAHLGMGLPALKATLSYQDRLLTGITYVDNISSGYSYFFSEVQRVKHLAELLSKGEYMFVIFDELFRGTNVKDAFDALSVVTTKLASWDNSLFVISSHLTEVAEHLSSIDSIQTRYFDSFLENGQPVFTYQLKEGVSSMRLGMTLIMKENILKMLEKQT
ncbi:MAG: MutS-related protein [Microbacter sp.]